MSRNKMTTCLFFRRWRIVPHATIDIGNIALLQIMKDTLSMKKGITHHQKKTDDRVTKTGIFKTNVYEKPSEHHSQVNYMYLPTEH